MRSKKEFYHITITANKRRDISGNTYHRTHCEVSYKGSSRETISSDVTYGYGSAYLDTAYRTLVDSGIFSPGTDIDAYRRKHGHKFSENVHHNVKKSEI